MFLDGRSIPNGTVVESEVCIIGAGAAGITLALELLRAPYRVVLLESGGLEFDSRTQALYEGEVTGENGLRPPSETYPPLDEVRLRYFGGSTNHWEGRCGPLGDSDLAQRPWIPLSGWPITRSSLDPYYTRAATLCQLPSSTFDAADLEAEIGSPRLPLDREKVQSVVFYQSPPTNFGETYRTVIKNSPNIKALLHSNAVEIDLDNMARVVRSVRVKTLGRNEFSVSARYFVLATGGIENARLLLLSNRAEPSGIGNEHDLVGRFFMEHPKLLAGAMLLHDDNIEMNYYAFMPESQDGRTIPCMNWLVLSDSIAEREKIARYSVWPEPASQWCCWTPEGYQSLRTVWDSVSQGRIPEQLGSHIANIVEDSDLVSDRALYEMRQVVGLDNPRYYALISSTEQAPNRDSRVTLTNSRDRLGQSRVRLHMQAGELDRQTVLRGTQVLADEVARAGLGRVRVLLDEEDSWSMASGRAHHMGTTRMSLDPRHGVVDANCRVHSTDNLFVAGASVFPTSGCGVPTLTVVALAVRLADHLARLMSA